MKVRSRFVVPFVAGALALGACSDGTGPDRGGSARVLLSRGGAASTSLATAALSGLAAGAARPLLLSSVETIEVTITEVEAHRMGTDSSSASGWVRLPLSVDVRTVNLLNLPVDTTSGLLLARGDLEPGRYTDLRLRVDDGFITLNESVTVGQSTLPANQRIALKIPSGVIKTGASFEVPQDSAATVRVIFDADASVRQVNATGSGQVIMNPVLRARSSNRD